MKVTKHGVIGDDENGEPISLEQFLIIRNIKSLPASPEIQAMINDPVQLAELARKLGIGDRSKK